MDLPQPKVIGRDAATELAKIGHGDDPEEPEWVICRLDNEADLSQGESASRTRQTAVITPYLSKWSSIRIPTLELPW